MHLQSQTGTCRIGRPTGARFRPLEWFPRLRNAGDPQRAQWRLIGGAVGVAEAAVDGREAFRYGIAG